MGLDPPLLHWYWQNWQKLELSEANNEMTPKKSRKKSRKKIRKIIFVSHLFQSVNKQLVNITSVRLECNYKCKIPHIFDQKRDIFCRNLPHFVHSKTKPGMR